ncbi:MAG: hypothetical protein M9945_12440 [Aquamicrobium sp.]|uniref:hypothetical protein n=1 Tax=Aquamicrobium sp. TaxID=1872579 RepID=UPI00349EE0A3|nr:hypothetical protein [Aquamicrobium sp.]
MGEKVDFSKRTPGPWYVTAIGSHWQVITRTHPDIRPAALIAQVRIPGKDGWPAQSPLGLDEATANAAFIVRAVNAHDDLVDALKDIEGMIDNCPDVPRDPASLPMAVLAHVRAALARHGEGKP